jgi:hypothetical protein
VEKQILKKQGNNDRSTYPDRGVLFVTRYSTWFIPLAFVSMALFHFPLFLNRKIRFYKLMGSGKNGTFDIWPDLNQWGTMVFYQEKDFNLEAHDQDPVRLLGPFIRVWWSLFCTSIHHVVLEPVAGHGTWDGKQFVSPHQKQEDPAGKIAVLTRATIRLSKLRQFWGAVPAAAIDLSGSKGFLYSIGIGEIPFVKQATFSIWNSVEEMKQYAYGRKEHQEVIRRTRKEDWYSEEMFLRFRVLKDNLPETAASHAPQNTDDR